MIWFRRALAVLLGIVFIVVFVVTILLLRVNDTFLSPSFINREIAKVEPFAFLYDEVVPLLIEENEEDIPDAPLGIDLSPEDVTGAVREVLPPEWLQGRVQDVLTEVMPYAVGDRDTFELNVPLAERVRKAAEASKELARQSGVYSITEKPEFKEEVALALEDLGDLPLGITLEAGDVADAAGQVLEPVWVQEQVERNLDAAVAYAVGDTEELNISVPLRDRVERASGALKGLAAESGVYSFVESPEFSQEVAKALEDFGELPLGIAVAPEDATDAARQVFEPAWVQAQAEGAVDAFTAYMTGSDDDLRIVIMVGDRVQPAAEAFKDLLRQSGAYNAVLDEVLGKLLADYLGESLDADFGITLTAEEISDALHQAIPEAWVQEQVEAAIDAVIPYMTGQEEQFAIAVPLEDRISPASEALAELADRKLEELFATYPDCTLQESLDLVPTVASGEVPSCRPPGYPLPEVAAALGVPADGLTWEDLEQASGMDLTLLREGVTLENVKRYVDFDIQAEVEKALSQNLPKTYTLTVGDLRDVLSAEDEDKLDEARDVMTNGLVLTREDLDKLLDQEQIDALDDARRYVIEGFTFNEGDLRELMEEQGWDQEPLEDLRGYLAGGFVFNQDDFREFVTEQEGGAQTLDQIDQARGYLGTARRYSWGVYVLWGVLLAVIGVLGGRHWGSRFAWAAIFLAIASLLVFLATGPIYGQVAKPVLIDLIDQQVQVGASELERLSVEKGKDVAFTVVQDFLNGLNMRALVLFIIGLLVFGVSLTWESITGLARSRRSPPPPPA